MSAGPTASRAHGMLSSSRRFAMPRTVPLLVGILVLLNAAFAGTELALVSLREGQLQRLEAASKSVTNSEEVALPAEDGDVSVGS